MLGACSSVAVVGAIGVLIGVSVYYLRYMRSSALQLPSIIEVGKSIRAPRYSKYVSSLPELSQDTCTGQLASKCGLKEQDPLTENDVPSLLGPGRTGLMLHCSCRSSAIQLYLHASGRPELWDCCYTWAVLLCRLRKQPDSTWEGDWDNDNWDDERSGRIGDQKHGSKWDEDF